VLENTPNLSTAFMFGLYTAPLVIAAVWDAWKFRIPNILPMVIAAAFIPAALLSPQPIEWAWHLGMGLVMLVAGALLFARGLAGGGDVKLAAACALWMGPLLPGFLVFMTILGGVVVLVLLALRYSLAMVMLFVPMPDITLPRILLRGEGVPYGIAIAGAGLWMAPQVPMLAG
jgi:prepilin peptidase CpaA